MYNYHEEREWIFTTEGISKIIKLIEFINKSTQDFIYLEDLIRPLTGDTWNSMACVDFLVEIENIKEIIHYFKDSAQKRLFIIKKEV